MPAPILSAVFVVAALLQGAEPNSPDAPVTVEAAPAESVSPTDPAPLPNIDLPALTFQGEPVPPQRINEPTSEDKTEPAAETGANAPDSKGEGQAQVQKPISEEMIRPTEKKDRSGQKVVAFWFITTGK